MSQISRIASKVQLLRSNATERDARMADVLAVRRGQIEAVAPDLFPEGFDKAIIANFIDVAARDMAELLAPLPNFSCSSGSMIADNAKKFADKRTKIAHYYVTHSELQRQMFTAADWYFTFGFLPFVVEIDYDAKCPVLRAENPVGSYPEIDRFGRTKSFTKVIQQPAHVLAAQYPEYAGKIIDQQHGDGAMTQMLEVVRYHDADVCVLYLPQRHNLVLDGYENVLGECPYQVAVRPGVDDDEMRGQFDDVVWVQIAKARMALYGMEAAEKSITAPLAVPSDVQEFAFGSDALLRTSSPEKIRRVGIEMSPAAMQEEQVLEHELRVGARYPEARSGNAGASIITGRGIQELLGGFDTQIKGAQEVLRETFRKLFRLAFKADETYFGNETKSIRGTVHGAPFEMDYRPARDIKGDHTIEVTYGLAAGMDPNRWLVWVLQLRGDKLIPREFVQRNLPLDINVTQMQQELDIEETRDAVKRAVLGMAEAVPILAQQGQSPAQIISQMTTLIDGIRKGKPIEEAAALAFAPPPPPEGGPGEPGAGGAPEGLDPSTGLPFGVAPGQAGQGPGGRPDLQYLLANLSAAGSPNLSAGVVRRIPAG